MNTTTGTVQIIQDSRGWFFHQNENGQWRTRTTGEPLLDTDEGPRGTTVPMVIDGQPTQHATGFAAKVAMMLARQAYPHHFA